MLKQCNQLKGLAEPKKWVNNKLPFQCLDKITNSCSTESYMHKIIVVNLTLNFIENKINK